MPNDEPTPSRREVIKTGVSLWAAPTVLASAAALAASTATNAASTAATTTRPASGLVDPKAAYAKPPYPAQHQQRPGIQSKMQPVPDCGEQSYRGSGKLAGRRALITGGDSGIGRAAAIAFAREGADVAIGYLPEEEGDAQEVLKLIRDAGRKAVGLPGDITSEDFCTKLVADAVSQLGGLDILVNNAATQSPTDAVTDATTEQFDRIFKTNVYAMFWITRAAIPHLPPGSAIIGTTSIQAYKPSDSLFDYAMTKACIANFTKSMAKQLMPKGIRINAIAPGPIWTPIQIIGKASDKPIQSGNDTPFKRPGQPAELAASYVLLASNDASYMTGEILGITGGESPM